MFVCFGCDLFVLFVCWLTCLYGMVSNVFFVDMSSLKRSDSLDNKCEDAPHESSATQANATPNDSHVVSKSRPTSPIGHNSTHHSRTRTSTEFFNYPSGFGIRVDARSHLEVFDKKHRYGKNLRLYYTEWVRLRVDMQFFEWLESPDLKEVSLFLVCLFV